MATIVGIQLAIEWENKAANYEKVRRLIDSTSFAPGSLVILPEIFATGCSKKVAKISEEQDRPTERFLSGLAKEFKVFTLGGISIIGSDGRGRNEAVAFDVHGKEIARYCKIHPFSFAGEHERYATGEKIVTFEWEGFTVAPFICYDLRFPEIFRLATRQGANLFAEMANWPAARELHWLTLLRARAIENLAYIAGINRTGRDPKNDYSGRSQIIDPRGHILAEASSDETLIQADVSVEYVKSYRQEFPALKDMQDRFFNQGRESVYFIGSQSNTR